MTTAALVGVSTYSYRRTTSGWSSSTRCGVSDRKRSMNSASLRRVAFRYLIATYAPVDW
jgi:hypothetical protein